MKHIESKNCPCNPAVEDYREPDGDEGSMSDTLIRDLVESPFLQACSERQLTCKHGQETNAARCIVCVIDEADAQIAELDTALHIAAGMLSTFQRFSDKHPQSVLDLILCSARKGESWRRAK